VKRFVLLLVLAVAVAGAVASTAQALRFEDSVCPPDSSDTKVCPQGVVGTSYSLQIKGVDGTGCVPFVTFSLDGGLPPGLTMSSSGLISGTPTESGDWQFYIDMHDVPASQGGVSWCSDSLTSSRLFDIKVAPQLKITTSSPLPTATVNQPYSVTLAAAGGGTQTWTVDSGTLPAGLTLSTNGVISGTPTTPGTANFTVKVTDGTRVDHNAYTLDAIIPLAATASAPSANGEVSTALSPLTLTATNGKPPYTWAPAAGTSLPAGLELSPAPSDPAQALILGVPSVAGSFSLMFTVTDALGETSTVDVSLTIAAKLAIKTKLLRPAKAGHRYTARLATTGGEGPFAWRIVRGKLPVGLYFNKNTGAFRGVPGKAGTFTVYIGVKDALGVVVTPHKFVIKVLA
jgi:large repetitive protein